MSAVTLSEVKAHLNITTDDDDELLTAKIAVAEQMVQDYLGIGNAPLTAGEPAPVKEAIRKLVAEMYENREINTPGSFGELSPSIAQLLGPYRSSWFGECV